MSKTIYDLKLHEHLTLSQGFDVTRVPGGWLYQEWVDNGDTTTLSSTFVPYHDEFRGGT